MNKGDRILPLIAAQTWKVIVDHWRDMTDDNTFERFMSVRFEDNGDMVDNSHRCYIKSYFECGYKDWQKLYNKTIKKLRDGDYIDSRGVLLKSLPKPKPKSKVWVDEDDVHLFDCFMEDESYGLLELSCNAAGC